MREGATLRGDGEIVDFDLAPGPTSPALAVIGSCPEGFGSQRANDEFKQCIGPLQFASMELDELGRQSGERVPLPTDASEGALFSSRRVSVWDDRDGKPAVYAQGSWQNVRTDPPSTSGTVDRCASQDHFWLLTGTNGPRSLTGQDNAVPMESNYELFRMRLDGSLDNPWERVIISGLEDADSAEMACGENEAFVRVNFSLFSTQFPDRPVPDSEGVIELRANEARRPVAFLDYYDACAAVLPGGRLLPSNDPPGSVTREDSNCNSVPWTTGEGVSAIGRSGAGKVFERPW